MDTKINTGMPENGIPGEQPKVKHESKNRIKVDFERAPLLERLKAKFVTGNFITKVIWFLFRFLILLGVSFVIISLDYRLASVDNS